MLYPILLLKQSEKQYISQTIEKGTIYMNSLSFYRNLERRDKNDVVGDKNEGKIADNFGYFMKCADGKYHRFPGTLYPNKNVYIYCTYGIYDGNSEFDNNTIKHIVHKEFFNSFKERNLKLFILKNTKKTLDKIYNFRKNYKVFQYGFINYKPYISSDTSYNDLDYCFYKKERYSYQNEFRIAVETNQNKDHEIINIGKLDEDEYMVIDIESNKDLKIIIYGENDGMNFYYNYLTYKWI
ncbi:hypothetical protein [Ructibacterium gallinarum]|uniref:Uncharacterized protein n=1 Tax=Ructibacterium gallinarum TaxID=2779355 RepID=A0A9D5M2N5_9FIRM|nr:hypothetical protein [Ructibacterium gallinarum]MBE5041016.1 hypothetical protein [Ructibacterium gallinarum]